MKRLWWFKFGLALPLLIGLWLVVISPAVLRGSQAQPAGSGVHSMEAQSPIIDPPIDIWSDGLDNNDPSVTYNSRHDEYLVVWYTQQDAYTHDIWARRVRGDGGLEAGFVVATIPGEIRQSPVVAYSPAQDQYLIAYTNFYTGGLNCDVYATRISWDGSWTSGEFAIADAVDGQLLPAVVYNGRDDEYLVVYVNQWTGGLIDVYAQRVRASDGQLVGQSTVASGMDGARTWPSVTYSPAAYDGAGGYLIAYSYQNTATYAVEIRSKPARADLAGLWSSPETTVCPTGNGQYQPVVAAGPGEYLVIWAETIPDPSGKQVRGRRLSLDGTPQGDPVGFDIGEVDTVDELYQQFALAYGDIYGYLATWHFEESSPPDTLYGRYVLAGQDSASDDQFAVASISHTNTYPAVACEPSGDCLVVNSWWDGGDYDIEGRFVRLHRVYAPVVLRNAP
jgi:hypothetical protein